MSYCSSQIVSQFDVLECAEITPAGVNLRSTTIGICADVIPSSDLTWAVCIRPFNREAEWSDLVIFPSKVVRC